MKKVSKHFEVTDCSVYKSGSSYLVELPKGMEIKYYLYDEDNGIYIGILKKKLYIKEIALLTITIMCIMFSVMYEQPQHTVNISNTIYYKEGFIGLNILNDKINKEDISVQLSYKGGALTKRFKIKPGHSIGNVKIDYSLKKGSYMCMLDYSINNKYRNIKKEYEVLLIVK